MASESEPRHVGEQVSRDASFVERTDPFNLFSEWLDEAASSELNDPNAMTLATVDAAGLPNARTVLLKAHGPDGFVFFTNYEGTKGRELLETPKAALLFHWKTRRRQVRVRGAVEQVSAQEADAYFNSRHPLSRLSAWASDQSRPLQSRQALLDRQAGFEAKYGTETIPRPPYWSGFRVVPEQIEFWQDGAYRLHDRVMFVRDGDGGGGEWQGQRLYP